MPKNWYHLIWDSERLAYYIENRLDMEDLMKVLKANRVERLNLASILRKIKF